MYRFPRPDALEIFLVHPGGPFWKKKDVGAWVIPRGAIEPDEELMAAAVREFHEETGLTPVGPYLPLGEVRHNSGKVVHAWAFRGDCDPTKVRSNLFEIEWPPKSGNLAQFPEVDRADFFSVDAARQKILPSEEPFIDRVLDRLAQPTRTPRQMLAQATLEL